MELLGLSGNHYKYISPCILMLSLCILPHNVLQTVKLYKDLPFAIFEYTIGPIPYQ